MSISTLCEGEICIDSAKNAIGIEGGQGSPSTSQAQKSGALDAGGHVSDLGGQGGQGAGFEPLTTKTAGRRRANRPVVKWSRGKLNSTDSREIENAPTINKQRCGVYTFTTSPLGECPNPVLRFWWSRVETPPLHHLDHPNPKHVCRVLTDAISQLKQPLPPLHHPPVTEVKA